MEQIRQNEKSPGKGTRSKDPLIHKLRNPVKTLNWKFTLNYWKP